MSATTTHQSTADLEAEDLAFPVTKAVYTLPARSFIPLPNGFNAELANYVYDIISDHKKLWKQKSWRQLVQVAPGSSKKQGLRKAMNKMLAIEQDMTNPTCGTAMCFAGWVNEAVKVDWVIDGRWLEHISAHGGNTVVIEDNGFRTDLCEWADTVAVLKGEHVGYTREWPHKILSKDLENRGFSQATHVLVGVEQAALAALGIRSDVAGLFGARNDLPMLRRIIDFYTEYGPNPSPQAAAEFIGENNIDAGDCMCECCVGDRQEQYEQNRRG